MMPLHLNQKSDYNLNTIKVPNIEFGSRSNVGPDLGPNCLQRLSADDTSR